MAGTEKMAHGVNPQWKKVYADAHSLAATDIGSMPKGGDER